MATATWNGTVIAESEEFELVEGNIYFPPDALRKKHFRPSAHTSVCGWKGTASYYDVVVGDAVNESAAWFYPAPKDAAKNITGYIAFWKGVEVTST